LLARNISGSPRLRTIRPRAQTPDNVTVEQISAGRISGGCSIGCSTALSATLHRRPSCPPSASPTFGLGGIPRAAAARRLRAELCAAAHRVPARGVSSLAAAGRRPGVRPVRRRLIAAQPSRSYSLYGLGAGFADFLEATRPAGTGPASQRRFAKAGTKTHSQRGAALDRNGLSVSTETACRFEPKSPVGNSEICMDGRLQAPYPSFKLPRRGHFFVARSAKKRSLL
jgi:hypothetical protein